MVTSRSTAVRFRNERYEIMLPQVRDPCHGQPWPKRGCSAPRFIHPSWADRTTACLACGAAERRCSDGRGGGRPCPFWPLPPFGCYRTLAPNSLTPSTAMEGIGGDVGGTVAGVVPAWVRQQDAAQ